LVVSPGCQIGRARPRLVILGRVVIVVEAVVHFAVERAVVLLVAVEPLSRVAGGSEAARLANYVEQRQIVVGEPADLRQSHQHDQQHRQRDRQLGQTLSACAGGLTVQDGEKGTEFGAHRLYTSAVSVNSGVRWRTGRFLYDRSLFPY